MRRVLIALTMLLPLVAVAGIIFVPVGGVYENTELAEVVVERLSGERLRIATTGLGGELQLDAADVPPRFEPPPVGCARLPLLQQLELLVRPANGNARGRTTGEIAVGASTLRYRGSATGSAECMTHAGRACGQLVVDLDLRIALSDPADPGRVGSLRMQWLGSLVRGAGTGQWVAASAAAALKTDDALLQRLLDTMDEGDSCGV